MDLQKVGWGGGMNCIDLAQDGDKWRALIKTVLNFRIPCNTGFFSAENWLASEEGQCSME